MSKDSGGKKDFYSLADLTRDFEKRCPTDDPKYFMTAAMLAQAQQMAVVSGRLADIAESLEQILILLQGVKRGE